MMKNQGLYQILGYHSYHANTFPEIRISLNSTIGVILKASKSSWSRSKYIYNVETSFYIDKTITHGFTEKYSVSIYC